MDRPGAQLAHPLGQLVDGGEDLRRLFVEQQMIVAEMRARDMPVEILGLGVEGIGVGHQPVQRFGDFGNGVAGQIGLGGETRARLWLGADFLAMGHLISK